MSIEKYGFVYIWRDRKHKRYYIGCHWGSVDDGYICSSTWMKRAYLRRPQDFKRRILKTDITHRPDMYLEEQRYFDMVDASEIKPNPNPKYYNLCLNVGNLWHQYDEKIKTIGQKISESKKGISTGPCSEETKRKISEANTGKKRTPEQRAASSAARKGVSIHSEEEKRIRSERMKGNGYSSGLIHSKYTKEKRAKSRAETWARKTESEKRSIADKISKANIGCVGRTGQTLTEDHKRKISESRLGDKHWNRGKHWYNNGSSRVMDTECPEGFVAGRGTFNI